jgi:hypothetical protein
MTLEQFLNRLEAGLKFKRYPNGEIMFFVES